jgi:hypothetical protein
MRYTYAYAQVKVCSSSNRLGDLTNRTTNNFVVTQFHTDSLSVAKVDVRPRLTACLLVLPAYEGIWVV